MTLEATLGWWVVPLSCTTVFFAVAWWKTPKDKSYRSGSYDLPDITGVFTYGAALIGSLIAWLIWAVLT